MELLPIVGAGLPSHQAERVAAQAALPSGHRIHEYEIQRKLGGGGFGVTYLARDAHLDLRVAIKEYFPVEIAHRDRSGAVAPWWDDPQLRERYDGGLARFLEEARVLAALRHPHIVRVLRYFRAQGTAYIVMEYEAGWPLRRWVPRHQPLTRTKLLGLVLPLLDAVEAVHAAGFLHRDIKPDNILVRPGGAPVLLDFGAAARVGMPQPGGDLASPGFSAPEQYEAPGRQGPWTDVYALGAVMYWMLTGRRPLEASLRKGTDTQRRAEDLAPSGAAGPALLRLVDRSVHMDLRERPQSVAELRGALVDAAAEPTGAGGWPAIADPQADEPTTSMDVQGRTLLAAVLFVDLVRQSLQRVDDQVATKCLLDQQITAALQDVLADTRLAIDTGDGVALCFFADPGDALRTALRLRDFVENPTGEPVLQLRMGLHVGPVRLVRDINQRTTALGDGMNAACRVMDFARPGQVLASAAFTRAMQRLGHEPPGLFGPARTCRDKHGRSHEVHPVLRVRPRRPAIAAGDLERSGYSPTVPVHLHVEPVPCALAKAPSLRPLAQRQATPPAGALVEPQLALR